MTDPVTGSAARCPHCGQTAEDHVAALCRLQAPGQERRAEPLTTSAAERTTQHDPGRVVPGSAAWTVAECHQAHYRLCGCLAGSAECCDQECICHVLD